MKWRTLILCLAYWLTLQPGMAAELTIITENLPPLNYLEDGNLVGPSVEVVREIQKRVGSHEPIQVYPWARAYQIALEKENVVLFGMTHTADRQNLFKWVGPLATKRDILVAKKGSGIEIRSLEDAKKVRRIGTLRDDTRERLLQSLGFTNLEAVSDEQLNAQKLILQRIDLWAYKIPGLRTVCDLAGVDHHQLYEVYHLRTIDVSIALSRTTNDAIVDRWLKAFQDMTLDGTLRSIRKKWNDRLPDAPFPELE